MGVLLYIFVKSGSLLEHVWPTQRLAEDTPCSLSSEKISSKSIRLSPHALTPLQKVSEAALTYFLVSVRLLYVMKTLALQRTRFVQPI